jgi:hypothetical protein
LEKTKISKIGEDAIRYGKNFFPFEIYISKGNKEAITND